MRLVSARICHGTVKDCITWNRVLCAFVTFMACIASACVNVSESEWAGERRHVACFELLYICGW